MPFVIQAWKGAKILEQVRWAFSVRGRNITDERYVTQGVNNLPLGYGFRAYGVPRTYGVTLSQDF
jgi:iron complex outermembrane recepter protein